MELLTLNELQEAIQNGQIDDYTPYIENDYTYRRFLLSQGICVDEILNYQDYPLLLDVINRGEYTEYYEKWTKSFVAVRQSLAGRGYFPEIFVKDKNPEVRLNVLRCHPEYTLELLKDPDLVTKVEDYLVKQHQPSMNALKYYMNIITPQHENYQPAKLKETAMSGTNSTISTTMTTYQLFLANNPAWAKDYTIQQIKIVSKYENQLRSVNITQEDFESIMDPTDIAEMMQLLIKEYLRTKDR